MAQIGVDALDPLEAPPFGDCDIAEAKRILKGRVCLVGNLDDMEVLDKKPKDEILAMGKKLIDLAGSDGFVLSGTASGTYGKQAAQNFIALVELVKGMAYHSRHFYWEHYITIGFSFTAKRKKKANC